MKKLLITIFTTLLAIVSNGQQWIKTYCDTGEYGGVFAVETYDKGFLIGGAANSGKENSILYKTDVNGNILWQRNIGTSGSNTNITAICTTPDGGCAIVGEISKANALNEAFLLKLNACGEMDWAKRFHENASVTTTSVNLMKDGGFIFNLQIDSQTFTYANPGWVCRCDKNGNLLWSVYKKYQPVNLFVDDSDKIILTGFYEYVSTINGGSQIPTSIIYVDILDSNGMQLMQTATTGIVEQGQKTLPAPDGTYLTFGFEYFSHYFVDMFLWNNSGHLIGYKSLGDTDNGYKMGDLPSDFIRVGNSSYILMYSRLEEDLSDYNYYYKGMRLQKTTSDTFISKDTTYTLGFDVQPVTINATTDGKYIISGHVITGHDITTGIYVAKINSNLEPDSFYQTKYNYDYLCSSMQDTGTILLDNSPLKDLAIDENMKPEAAFSIYPNPARDFIELSCSGLTEGAVQFSLYNILGVNVISFDFRTAGNGNLNQQIDLQNIPAGFYIVELDQGDKRLVQKLMIEK